MASVQAQPRLSHSPPSQAPLIPSPPLASTSQPTSAPALAQQVQELQKAPVAQTLWNDAKRRQELIVYFAAGGCAGAASRTVVSPLERLKILQQVQPRQAGRAVAYSGVWAGLVKMWREEGFRGFMRGNGVNCVRIVPYSAVQFTSYEQLKKWFSSNGQKKLDTPTRLCAGALAGICSVVTTYPLDLVRSRLSIASASLSTSFNPDGSAKKIPGIWGMTAKVYAEEGGVRGLYKGIVPTAVGVAPYVGINFAAYELLRGIITPPDKQTTLRKLLCGALAGTISQTCTYPLDVLRRKMQVNGMKDPVLGVRYSSATGAVITILKTEGIQGMYRGLWPNLRAVYILCDEVKVAPSIATSFFVYESVKEFLGQKSTFN
ncbi:mitochondrial carrier [Calocera cornea HHB12733]|uniref:Mitochondrial carrier n=1 Tax=Calocera cornea HHB12733 TaxID=1353952 RepID=A0A165GWK8_9BASI|nr:mitochondrial carrier [Calocera cornea HHB12733]